MEWPTDVTNRLLGAILRGTDGYASLTLGTSTPAVPDSAYIGAPPSVLVLGTLVVIPTQP